MNLISSDLPMRVSLNIDRSQPSLFKSIHTQLPFLLNWQ